MIGNCLSSLFQSASRLSLSLESMTERLGTLFLSFLFYLFGVPLQSSPTTSVTYLALCATTSQPVFIFDCSQIFPFLLCPQRIYILGYSIACPTQVPPFSFSTLARHACKAPCPLHASSAFAAPRPFSLSTPFKKSLLAVSPQCLT